MSQGATHQAAVSQGAPATGASSPAGAALPARGGYACSEVDLAALRATERGRELALALPFAELFSALLPARSHHLRQLQLDYVALERLGERATYSAQVGEVLEQGRALELRLLVARGPWLCIRGRAVLELEAPHPRGSSHG